ncbi:unnamed protein product [Allacma fusca]|uniref:Uncharacterized protein n=1 Tax=Allacma fusca TaxID=39272 RepID=A0A8J2PAT0_9HEXA|nr:unnamed protein product [Allacma fusca]
MGKDQPGSYEPGVDARLDFLLDLLTRSLKIKLDKWTKMLLQEDYRTILLEFFDRDDVPNLLIVTLNAGGQLITASAFPTAAKAKGIYFMKKDPSIPLMKDDVNFKENLVYGELPAQPLESLVTYIEDVAQPLISSAANQDKWPDTVVGDVKQHTQEITGVLYSVQGQLKGKTLLPMPLSLDAVDENERNLQEVGPSEVDLQLKTQIETLIIKWAQQINEVLKQDSSKALQSGTNPTPIAEMAFWEDRVQDLQCIYDQLNDEKIRKIATIIEGTGSTYWPAFKSMFRNVVAALAEAQDILAYLKPLKKHIDAVQNAMFDELIDNIRPMMHCVCLVWGHSRYYCSAARIIVLLQEICNLLIEMARSHLGGSAIFQMDPEEGLVKVTQVVEVLQFFRDLYDEHRSKLPVYFDDSTDPKTWDFLPHLVFKRYDKFLDRMKDLKSFFESSTEYYKLERVDFGGSKGRYLTAQVQEIYNEFLEFYQKYSAIQYDVSDPEDDSFVPDYEAFQEKVEDIDQRLAAVCVNAFDDCHTPESVYKLVQVLGSLLERPAIKNDIEPKYPEYIKMLEKDFDTVKELFDEQILAFEDPADRKQVQRTMPPYASSVHWAKDMRSRIEEPVEQFKSLELPIAEEEEAKVMLEKQEELSGILQQFQDKTFDDWKEKIKNEAGGYLTENLINREDLSAISVNFNSELAAALKEVKYMRLAGFEDIPAEATKLYDKKDAFRKNLTHLDQITRAYNRAHRLANSVELSLLQPTIAKIDEVLKEGEDSIKWSDEDKIWPFIETLQPHVKELEGKLDKSQDNIKTIKKLVQGWISHPLFERKDGRKDQLLSLDEQAQERKQKRYKEIQESSDKLKELILTNKELLKSSDIDDRIWTEYLTYIDGIVLDGMVKAVAVSFGYICDHTDPNLTPSPFIEVRMELEENDLTFVPDLDLSQPNSLWNVMEDVMSDITHQSSLVDRVKEKGGIHYLSDVESNEELLDMKATIENRIQTITDQAYDYQLKFETVAWIWEDDRQEYLSQFLKYGHQLTPEELEAKALGEEPQEIAPTLEQFKEIIDKFENLYLEVEKFEHEKVFDKWLRLDMRPFRQALLNTVKRWSLMFKQYLIDSVVGGLSELENFLKEGEKGLTKPLREGDLQTLISVMEMLHKVKDKEAQYDNMFEPVKQYIELLKMYDYELPENVFVQLEELPQKWTNLKKLSIQTKHTVAPLQAQEVSSIRKRIADFDAKQQAYREAFKKYDFFNQNCQFPYKIMDDTHIEMKNLEEEYEDICGAASLFEVHVPDPKSLKQCRRELKFVKQLWDFVIIVDSSFEDWKTTPWKNINVENMDIECKRMAKEVKAMDKDVKNWTIFNNLEAKIRNMISSLKSVSELQNPSIRERHWQELMAATKVKFNMNDSTTLADLVALNLHNFEDEVKNIVDKAVKESSMEKTLKELDATWKNQEYEFETHPRTGTRLVKASEELIELLEDNQVQLQNIAMSKYIDFFHEEVEYWQNKLFNADQVLAGLNEVQRTWGHLEPIFIATEDIRKNLPEDSARFDKIDKDFKEILKKISKTKNVIEATNQPGLVPELERLQKELAICEKALADYLETKRLAFPRFYFVSSVDLLDILSNGNEPSLVARHLTKLFDSMSKLDFTKEGDNDTKIAKSMWAKDGEQIDLNENCDCSGAVEQWLSRLEAAMKATIRHYFALAVNSYEDKPRDQWIMDFPAQTALCGTQIWWTTEVNIAFSKLEEGYENALKDYLRKQINQLSILIGLLLGQLTYQERQKIMTVCTIDVHSRDVVSKLIQMKVETSQAFQWQSQLRHRWDDNEKDCFANICDAQFRYWYEYLGNTPRLVITPLTDRCYITLTQSLHLIMGGAPAGPAGTGKTETTKDLGKAIGIMVYVFNCSEQMDYRSIGNIYKAGSLKRSDPDRPEDQVLMRALRDFNIPKIVTDDVPVFMGLIGDLFPALDVPRKRDLDFEKTVKIATLSSKLQPEDNFVLKVVQLQELLDVRHSVFIIGNAGTGKTQVWKCLFKAHQILKHKPTFNDLNPKAVTNDELFGIINPATREWKDGILSVLMRDQANLTGLRLESIRYLLDRPKG